MCLFFTVCVATGLPAAGAGASGGAPDSAQSSGSGGAGGSGGQKTPQPTIRFAIPDPAGGPQKVVFVLSLGADASTNADITDTLADNLKSGRTPNLWTGNLPVQRKMAFVPEGSWGLAEFLNQCAEYPESTAGAFIVMPASYESKNDNYLFVIRTDSRLQFNTLIATCAAKPAPPKEAEPTPAPERRHDHRGWWQDAGASVEPSPTPASAAAPVMVGNAQVEFASTTATGEYGHSVIQFLPLAVLTSIYLAFAPQRLTQSLVTRAFPVPSPLPPYGAQTQVQTENQTTLNSSGTATLQNNVVSAVGIAQLLFGRQGSTDHYTVHAAEDAAVKFINTNLRTVCRNWGTWSAPLDGEPAYCTWGVNDGPVPSPPRTKS
jgi:hypothetical protein